MTNKAVSPDELALRKWCRIADKIESDPKLLEVPLSNIKRWTNSRSDGVSMLAEWQTLIDAARIEPDAFAKLLRLLRSDCEASRLLKSYSPFPGVLSSAEVDEFTCAWKH